MNVTINDLQGAYDINFQTTPQRQEWFEPGYGDATIAGNELTGVDATGISWSATISIDDGRIFFDAILDPTNAPLESGLINDSGEFTRNKQRYKGELFLTRVADIVILRTVVKQGEYIVNVQFRKKT